MSLQKKYFGLAIIVLLIYSCGSDEGKIVNDTSFDRDSLNVVKNDDVKMYALPAPLQIATALKLFDVRYSEKLLARKSGEKEPFSNYSKALSLGINMIDLGYAAVYNQRQTSLNYVKKIKGLMEGLGITSVLQTDMVQRFEDNIENQDSLYRIILETYSKSHDYFKANQLEDVGLFILSGSYIEGLYLSLNSKNEIPDAEMKNLIAQQKLFLNNIMELLSFLPQTNEVKDIQETMGVLRKEYEPIDIIIEEGTNKIKIRSNINSAHVNSLLIATSQIRDKMLQP